MKIIATVRNPNKGQITQIWDFIPPDDKRDEDGILIIESRANGDILGIVLDKLNIVPTKEPGLGANFSYSETLNMDDAVLIRGAGKPN